MSSHLFLDLGETLIHDGQPFEHVIPSLKTISEFQTQTGDPLFIGLISDFGTPSETESELSDQENEFRQILEDARLTEFFDPFENKVTISARAGVRKPDHRIFDLAIGRSGVNATLEDCVFVTENKSHLLAARQLGMKVLGFRVQSPSFKSFSDWSEAPSLVAETIGQDIESNQEVVTAFELGQRGVVGFNCISRVDREYRGHATRMVQVNSEDLGELNGIHVPIPIDVVVNCDAEGKIASVSETEVAKADIDDAIREIRRLQKSGKIELLDRETLAAGTTHCLETDDAGRRVLVRRRFAKRG